jgi:hypothetical protein
MGREKQRVAGAAAALDIVAVANEYDRADAAAMAVANEMATRLGATRVAVGLTGKRGIRLLALSHTAWFKRNTAMVEGIEQAMDEAAEQRATIRVPASATDAVRIQVAHEALAASWDADGACTTFPLLTDPTAAPLAPSPCCIPSRRPKRSCAWARRSPPCSARSWTTSTEPGV